MTAYAMDDLNRERQRRYRERNREAVRARAAAWARENRAKDPEAARAYKREWYARNPEKQVQRQLAYAKANPEKRRDNEARRRARIAQAPIVEKINRAEIIARDRSVCHICKKRVAKAAITLDHLVPLSKGGNHTMDNLAVAHHTCNSRRKDGRLPAQLLLIGTR